MRDPKVQPQTTEQRQQQQKKKTLLFETPEGIRINYLKTITRERGSLSLVYRIIKQILHLTIKRDQFQGPGNYFSVTAVGQRHMIK